MTEAHRNACSRSSFRGVLEPVGAGGLDAIERRCVRMSALATRSLRHSDGTQIRRVRLTPLGKAWVATLGGRRMMWVNG